MVKKTIIFVAMLALAVGFGIWFEHGREVRELPHDAHITPDGDVLPIEPVPQEILTNLDTTPDQSADALAKTFDTFFGGTLADFGHVMEVQTYESPFGFTVQYDSRFTTENAWVVLPGGERAAAFAVVRYVPHTDCGRVRPEHCRPYLENPAIAFGVFGESPREVVSKHLDAFAEHLESVTINGIAAAQYFASVDGEGVVTILAPLKDADQTLVVQYTYDTKYDTEKLAGALTAAEQKQLVDAVLSRLTIR
ncbi:MAG: hypothetical protein RL150_191 [Candidatus Parcubacteria bacterium]|jgi:hypothetical protein